MKRILFLCLFIVSLGSHAQDSLGGSNPIYLESEIFFGRVIPNYLNYPKVGFRSGVVMHLKKDTRQKEWSRLYRHPVVGASLSFSTTGEKKLYGNEFSIAPFIEFATVNFMKGFSYRFNFGFSYFTTSHDDLTNPRNISIGSRLTWHFRGFMYKDIVRTKRVDYRVGWGILHSSNGHIQLPNYGLNSFMLSVSAKIKPSVEESVAAEMKDVDKTKHYFISAYSGHGVHELGNTIGMTGDTTGTKRGVYSVELSGGIIYKQFIKVRTGIAYRYYRQFKHHMIANGLEGTVGNIEWYSSNVYFLLGTELMIGRMAVNIMGGVNLHKPFFKDFYTVFSNRGKTDFLLKKWFPATFGLHYYIIDPSKKPKSNVYIAANIRANFGQADFSDIGLGYSYTIR